MMMAVFTVTDTGDSASDTGSLRYAITQSNLSGPGPNTIDFAIGTGAQTITLASQLPDITASVLIDGWSQGGTSYTGPPLITIDGSDASTGGNGLQFMPGSDGSTVRGLVLGTFNFGIDLQSGDNLVEGNYLGTTSAGTAAGSDNQQGGVDVEAGAIGNTIGGATSTPGRGVGNLLSGNTSEGVLVDATNSGTVIAGNLIGTDPTGTLAVPNGSGVITDLASGVIVGGKDPTLANVISGNEGDGIDVDGSDDVVEGNLIGTDITGTNAIPNGGFGVDVPGSGNTIGGLISAPGIAPGNVISGNTEGGIDLSAGQNLVVGNVIGLQADGSSLMATSNGGPGIKDLLFAATGTNTIGGSVGASSAGTNVISGNAGDGIFVLETSDLLIEGNRIGTDVTGLLDRGNAGWGVDIQGSSQITVGGIATGAGNLISGNDSGGVLIKNTINVHRQRVALAATGNLVEGNTIGTDGPGSVALPNTGYGIEVEYDSSGDATAITSTSDNTIGGTASGAGNLISGNADGGVLLSDMATANVVLGNKIGTDVAGTVALPNGTFHLRDPNNGLSDGVDIAFGATDNTVGGTSSGAGNLISGNQSNGVDINETGTTGNLVEGNLIGTDVTGTIALPNGSAADSFSEGAGVEIFDGAAGNTIGGANAGNVISGNLHAGIYVVLSAADNLIQGNMIGTTAAGNAGLGSEVGIVIQQSSGNTIGGAAPALATSSRAIRVTVSIST